MPATPPTSSTNLNRCDWPRSDIEIAYHDEEWGVPLHDDRKFFEFILLDGAQAGLSWATILKKRENYRAAFDNFQPEKVARYDEKKVAELLADPGIVRNRLKIRSHIKNAAAFLEVQDEFASFDDYIWRFVDGQPIQNAWKTHADIPATSPESDALSKDLKARGFNFVGSTIVYAIMQSAGLVNDHLVNCFRHKELQT